jgi:hypothetical protein
MGDMVTLSNEKIWEIEKVRKEEEEGQQCCGPSRGSMHSLRWVQLLAGIPGRQEKLPNAGLSSAQWAGAQSADGVITVSV